MTVQFLPVHSSGQHEMLPPFPCNALIQRFREFIGQLGRSARSGASEQVPGTFCSRSTARSRCNKRGRIFSRAKRR